MTIRQRLTLAACALLIVSGSASAISPEDKCEADKLKTAGKYTFCRMKAESKAIKTGSMPDYTKCVDKFTDKWGKAETKAGPTVCPSEGDVGSMGVRVTTDAAKIATLLAGGSLPAGCGNGTVEGGEDCDFGTLNGETCSSQTGGAEPFGALACTPGACTLDASGCLPRFEDTGLTIIDHQTGLEWEKKTGTVGADSYCPGGATCGDPNNVNNQYTWSNSGTAFDGGVQILFLDVLNDVAGGGMRCFAGHCDWRLPTIGGCCGIGPVQPAELESIVDCSAGAPCVDPAFGPTASSLYWSSSPVALYPSAVWVVFFGSGEVDDSGGKTGEHYVRAVRGGL